MQLTTETVRDVINIKKGISGGMNTISQKSSLMIGIQNVFSPFEKALNVPTSVRKARKVGEYRRQARLAVMSELVGRNIASFKDLRVHEALGILHVSQTQGIPSPDFVRLLEDIEEELYGESF